VYKNLRKLRIISVLPDGGNESEEKKILNRVLEMALGHPYRMMNLYSQR
jgi:hypothetical protein